MTCLMVNDNGRCTVLFFPHSLQFSISFPIHTSRYLNQVTAKL